MNEGPRTSTGLIELVRIPQTSLNAPESRRSNWNQEPVLAHFRTIILSPRGEAVPVGIDIRPVGAEVYRLGTKLASLSRDGQEVLALRIGQNVFEGVLGSAMNRGALGIGSGAILASVFILCPPPITILCFAIFLATAIAVTSPLTQLKGDTKIDPRIPRGDPPPDDPEDGIGCCCVYGYCVKYKDNTGRLITLVRGQTTIYFDPPCSEDTCTQIVNEASARTQALENLRDLGIEDSSMKVFRFGFLNMVPSDSRDACDLLAQLPSLAGPMEDCR